MKNNPEQDPAWDKTERALRELPKTEPGADLDAQILASAQHVDPAGHAGSEPASRKFIMVLATAAAVLLILGLGIMYTAWKSRTGAGDNPSEVSDED